MCQYEKQIFLKRNGENKTGNLTEQNKANAITNSEMIAEPFFPLITEKGQGDTRQ